MNYPLQLQTPKRSNRGVCLEMAFMILQLTSTTRGLGIVPPMICGEDEEEDTVLKGVEA